MFQDQIIAAIRTACAVIGASVVTAIISWLASVGITIELDAEFTTALTLVLFALAVAVYNIAVNWLAANVHPKIGYLLGIPKAPVYDDRESELLEADTIMIDRE